MTQPTEAVPATTGDASSAPETASKGRRLAGGEREWPR